jgi:hypothetical protein
MPLHYSLRWVKAIGPFSRPQPAADVRDLADAVAAVIAGKDLDRGGQIGELLSGLRELASRADAGPAAG